MNIIVGLQNFFLTTFGIKERRERAKKLEQLSNDIAEEKKLHEELLRILKYPETEITRAEFNDLPDSASIDPATCPIGTWFVYPKSDVAPEIVVIGHVVSSSDLLNSQWGWAALSLPKQGVNRYRARIIDKV